MLEWYRYDLQGTPIFYDANNNQRTASAYGVRHLFTGQQWYADVGLYDLRNRFYSPDIGRFLQPDPIGFRGDRTNLYRYCGNNAVTRRDPSGLQDILRDGQDDETQRVIVSASEIPSWPNFLGAQAPPNLIPYSWMAFTMPGRGDLRGVRYNGATATNRYTGQPYDPNNGYDYGLPDVDGGEGDPINIDATPIYARPPAISQILWTLDDSGWLRQQLLQYRSANQGRIAGDIKFAKWLDRFALGTSLLVGGGVVLELGGPVLAAGPSGLAESAEAAFASTQVTSVKIIIAGQAMTMGTTSANLHPINEKVLQLLEEEMVPWKYWRP